MSILRKNYVILFIIMITALIFSTALYSQTDTFKLAKTGHRKPPVAFDHRAHATDYEIKCSKCHHKAKEGEKVSKCSSCHIRRDQGNIVNLKGAFHQQCQECHREFAGPLACGRCHIKTIK